MAIHFNLIINSENIEEDALVLIEKLRPQWKRNSIKFKIFSEGITNKLVGAFHKEDVDKTDGIVIRVFGENSELMIDRDREQTNMCVLHKAGLGPALYATFDNGIAYGFVPGVTLDTENMKEQHMGRLIAKAMVDMHAIRYNPDVAPKLEIFDLIRKFHTILPKKFNDEEKQKRFVEGFPSIAELKLEMDTLLTHLEGMGSPIVFGHNDLLPKNIIYDEKQDKVSFIDYEYGCYTYEAFDIADHFQEYAGIDEIDYTRYPGREYQLVWLRTFLELKYQRDGRSAADVTDTDVERLYVQVQHFVLGAHFMWALWALIQAYNSTIDFDYLEFGKNHLDEYFNRKEAFLALKMPTC